VLRRLVPRILRYASVSVLATGLSLTVLGVLVGLVAVPAGWANVAATAAGTVPSFELNRRWVWGKTGPRSLPAEVLPFTILSLTGLAISTIAVSVAGAWAMHRDWPATARTVLVLATNVVTYGSLWVLQFILLDRVLFRPPGPTRRASQTQRGSAPAPAPVEQSRARAPGPPGRPG
jgi:putative flippase GtrA